jgi:organic radical activating enzyme
MANIGYIQVVRHCNHFCGFCSNPTSPYTHDFASMKVLVDDFVARGYFGVILTGGEPTLHPELPVIAAYARDQGLHVRMITNGHRLADRKFAKSLAEAGVQLAHVSVYSHRPEVEAALRGMDGTLVRAYRAIENANEFGIEVNINCVINKMNADHLDENVEYWIENHPYIQHFIWNNLDPSMGRAEVNQSQFLHRLTDCEVSLRRALHLLHDSGRSFRVEKMPLCYLTDFGWASTETRKIVKMEERIVHFLDDKQTVRQTTWDHAYRKSCQVCTLRPICGGLFDEGDEGYSTDELYPVFVPMRDTVMSIVGDEASDPSFQAMTYKEWEKKFREYNGSALGGQNGQGALAVGAVTERGEKLYEAKRNAEGRKADRDGVSLEKPRPNAE